MPLAAVQELRDDPERLCLTILGLRGYAHAKQEIDDYVPPKKGATGRHEPEGKMVDLVHKVAAEIIRRRRKEEEEEK